MDQDQVSIQAVSVIVPVYNAGEYLQKRVESLLNQTLKNIEIIFVLDCPTDGSDHIIKYYAAQDPRIRLIMHQENLHIGLSRNDGLQLASGEYIAFADHDDYCDPGMYERLYAVAKLLDADIAFSDMFMEKAGQLVNKEYFQDSKENVRERTLEELLKGNGFYYSVLSHLYKRDFLKKNKIRFVDTRKITLEDRYFNLLAYQKADKVIHLPEKLMYHVLYPESTQHSYGFKSLLPMINHLEQMSKFFHDNKEYQRIYEKEFSIEVVKSLFNSFLPEIRYKSPFHAFRMLRLIKDKPDILEALRNFGMLSRNLKGMWKIRCFYGFLKLYMIKY